MHGRLYCRPRNANAVVQQQVLLCAYRGCCFATLLGSRGRILGLFHCFVAVIMQLRYLHVGSSALQQWFNRKSNGVCYESLFVAHGQ
jgi:hypothetical protein